MICPMLDWGVGEYEQTAVELEPVAELVVDMARLSPGEGVIDLACGTGNAALLAAERGARVIGIDGAGRLIEVARQRAREQRLEVDFLDGNLLHLPLREAAADVVISVFGVIFASDPVAGLREVPRVAPGPPANRFPWYDPDALAPVARAAGLELRSTQASTLAIRGSSPEAYLARARLDPRAVATAPIIERAGVQDEVQEAMSAVLRDANEDPDAFLVHTPYVVHEFAVA